jgi:hypothetical protein
VLNQNWIVGGIGGITVWKKKIENQNKNQSVHFSIVSEMD